MNNPIHTILHNRHNGKHSGIASFCTANDLVIEAIFSQAKTSGDYVLIEGTANQINQFGGYTGMKPSDFRDYVYSIADRTGFDRSLVILGGDHMGPLVWSDLPAEQAMNNAKDLLRLCVKAGFRKIHLDTSMKLADDPVNERLSDEVIAERGAVLLEVCEEAYREVGGMRPVYIIGSEVPIPGGAQEEDAGLQVTSVKDFAATVSAYREKFTQHGIYERWNDVVGVVVQPGVEFGDKDVHEYDRDAAKGLCSVLEDYPGLIFEGHSTDYQTREKLREMVEDGIAILKVGPALTFALREGLFALSMIERELVPESQRADFPAALESVMTANPKNWQKYYHGSEHEQALARKYSYSDRCRYYMTQPEIQASITKLFANFENLEIPAGLLSQYMPRQYDRVRHGLLEARARELVKDNVILLVNDYNYAVREEI